MTDTKKNPLATKLKTSTSRLGLRALEPRILLDAAGFVTGAEVAMDALDTQNVAEDMAAIFDGNSPVSPSGETQPIELLISALNAADAEINKEVLLTRPLDDGGKNYALIQPVGDIDKDILFVRPIDDGGKNYTSTQVDADIDKDAQLTRPIDDGGKNYELAQFVLPSESDFNIALDDQITEDHDLIISAASNFNGTAEEIPLFSSIPNGLSDNLFDAPINFSTDPVIQNAGPFEIHSGETINVDLFANDAGAGELVGIIDPDAPSDLITLTVNEAIELASGLGIELLEDGTFNVTGPNNPTERFVSFDYVIQNEDGTQSQATATFDWPLAPTIDLDVLDDPTVEPNEAAGIIPLNISEPINIVTDADGNTTQATYSSVAIVNGVTVDLVATLNTVEIIEPSTGGNSVDTFEFNTTPFTNVEGDPNFDQLNANNRLPGDFGRANVTYALVDQATGNPVPLTFTVLFGDFDGDADDGTAERIIVNANDIDAFILEDGTGGANDDDTPGTDIIVSEEVIDGETFITFAGGDQDPTPRIEDTGNAVQLVFSNTAEFTVTLERDNSGRNIGFNAAVANIFGTPVIEDTNTGFENVFIENGDPVNVAAQSADVDDIAEGDIALLEITPGNIADGTDEIIAFNGDGGTSVSLPLDGSDTSQQSLTIGGTDIFIQYNTTSGSFEITEQSGAIIPQDDLDALIQAITYENTSDTPTEGDGTDRTLTFRVTDTGGLVSNDAVSTITVIDVPLDTDDDGVADEVDIDDDNDGILDTDEGLGSVTTGFTAPADFMSFRTDGRFGFATTGATHVNSGVSLDGNEISVGDLTGETTDDPEADEFSDRDDSSDLIVGDTVVYSTNGGANLVAVTVTNIDPNTTINFVFRDDGSSPNFEVSGDGDLGSAEESVELSIQFFDPNDSAFSTAADLGEIAVLIQSGQGTALTTSTSLSIGDIDDDPARRLEGIGVSADSISSFTLEDQASGGSLSPSFEGDFVRFRGTVDNPDDKLQLNFDAVDEIRIELLNDTSSNAGFGLGFSEASFTNAITTTPFGQDSDRDGIQDHLDIDSDNDGITDNIEAQSTAGFIAPSGIGADITDLNQDGLDDNFDSREVTVGDSAATQNEALITPVDTDSDDTPDFLDTNSDNEGGNDTAEAGLTGTATGLSDASTDADGDGLFDVFETQGGTDASDGFNVNESLAAGALALPDADGDATGGIPLAEDVDFRDAENIPDTDGDGITDNIDVDDDNDGILDIDEGLSFNPVSYTHLTLPTKA